MTVTVYSYPNNNLHLEILDSVEDTSFGKKSKLSLEERMALLDEIADMAMKFAGPDPQPLSDYAMSREGIYEDHP